MRILRPGALAACAALVPGCAAGRVSPPPPPPALGASAETRSPAARGASAGPPEAAPASLPAPAPAPASDPATDPASDPGSDPAELPIHREQPPLGWIAGQPLEPEELLVELGDVSSRELLLVVDKLVAVRLALAEAARLSIQLDPAEVERRFAAQREQLAEDVARSGKQRTLEDFIARELGLEPARYLERVRRSTLRQMLAERAVRAASLASETVALRLIVVADDEQLGKVQQALAAGRDFGTVARELSLDDSRENGGLVPFVVAQERSPLARLAFQTPAGEVAGPLPIGEHRFLIRVEERRAPFEGDWSAIGAAVEASLREHPVEDAEFVHWKLVMEGRYPIDLGPLWSLIGAAR